MSNKKAANGGFLRCGTTSSGELALRTGSDEIAERHQLSATQIRGSVHTGNEFVVAHLVAFPEVGQLMHFEIVIHDLSS